MNNERIKAFIRLLVMAILMLNSVLTAKGLNPIPFDESAFTDVALQVATGISVLWVWWKDNNVTNKAKAKKSLAAQVASGEVAVSTVSQVEDDEIVTELDSEYEKGDE